MNRFSKENTNIKTPLRKALVPSFVRTRGRRNQDAERPRGPLLSMLFLFHDIKSLPPNDDEKWATFSSDHTHRSRNRLRIWTW